METFLIVFCILFAGSFGGLLYSIQEKKISLPYRKGLTVDLGVINDLLFGFGGGFLIFLILPEFPKTEEPWGMVKLLSLSIAGGYSGRALIEKSRK